MIYMAGAVLITPSQNGESLEQEDLVLWFNLGMRKYH